MLKRTDVYTSVVSLIRLLIMLNNKAADELTYVDLYAVEARYRAKGMKANNG